MDTSGQLHIRDLDRLGAAYAAVCLERPAFVCRLSGWDAEKSARLLEARERLLREFDESGESTLDDLVGVELARCYAADAAGRRDDAEEHLYRLAATAVMAARMLREPGPVPGTEVADAVGAPKQGGEGDGVLGV